MAMDNATCACRYNIPFDSITAPQIARIRESAVALRSRAYARFKASSMADADKARWARRLNSIADREASQLLQLAAVASFRPMSDRDRQLAQLRAAAPLRPMGDVGRHSRDVVGLPLFEPTLL